MEKSALFIEIYGCDDLESTPVQTGDLELPIVDDPLSRFFPPTGKANALCRGLQSAAFISEVAGCERDMALHAQASVPYPSLDPFNLAKGTHHTSGKSSLRKLAIQSIVDRARNRHELSAIRDSDGWDRLAASCMAYLESASASG
jgi:hypothetical protein